MEITMIRSFVFVTVSMLVLSGCSDNNADANKVEGDHVWKEQTDMIDKAKDVENMLQDAANKQQQKINEQTH